MCMSCSVFFAVKNAIKAARKETNNEDYFDLRELDTCMSKLFCDNTHMYQFKLCSYIPVSINQGYCIVHSSIRRGK